MERKFLKSKIVFLTVLFFSACGMQCEENRVFAPPSQQSTFQNIMYLTKPDQSVLFTLQHNVIFQGALKGNPTIMVDTCETYQKMDGYGYTLTGGSALQLSRMSSERRASLLDELFGTDDDNIGISILRLSIGASDLDEFVYSYNDLANFESDFELAKFSMEQDEKYLIPILNEIFGINPSIKIISVPWSPPTWMKTNGDTKGGELKKECYDVYAQYFIRYIQTMANEGITVNAITVQNEPLHPGNNPSMFMSWEQQAEFVKNSLGPAFEIAGIETEIYLYDHNADRIDYPISIMDDQEAKKYVAGSAFHLYAGSMSDLSKVHQAHPDKGLYFTEQWTGANGSFNEDLGWHISNIVIGGAQNWCKAILEWNLAADSNLEPHTPGGCIECLGAITIDGDIVKKNVGYYIIAHASKFVRPGSVRINSNQTGGLINVAFKTPKGEIVVIIQNQKNYEQTFNISIGNSFINTSLPAKGVATIIM